MHSLDDFVKLLDDVKEVLIAVTSTITIAIICVQIIWDKLKRKK